MIAEGGARFARCVNGACKVALAFADLEIGDTADLEVCATKKREFCAPMAV
jgi:hypothetical protein